MRLSCPTDLPVISPYAPYTIDGTQMWSGAATSWSWTVTGGACDALLDATAGMTSFAVSGTSTSQMTFQPTVPGDYSVRLEIETDGDPVGCDFPVRVRAPGLRAVLCWDTTGDADLDLHFHRSGTTTPWFTTTLGGGTINPDDCFFSTCTCGNSNPSTPPTASWGYAASPLQTCSGSLEGECWDARGSCFNPRLESDNTSAIGLPEIVALDNPRNGETFRIMAHYYNGSIVTHPVVSVFCGDAGEVATFGATPDVVSGFTTGGGSGSGPMWRVADVTAVVDGSGRTTGCDVAQLHPSGSPTDYLVTVDDASY